MLQRANMALETQTATCKFSEYVYKYLDDSFHNTGLFFALLGALD